MHEALRATIACLAVSISLTAVILQIYALNSSNTLHLAAVELPSGGRFSCRKPKPKGGVWPAGRSRIGSKGGGDAGSHGLMGWPLSALQV